MGDIYDSYIRGGTIPPPSADLRPQETYEILRKRSADARYEKYTTVTVPRYSTFEQIVAGVVGIIADRETLLIRHVATGDTELVRATRAKLEINRVTLS